MQLAKVATARRSIVVLTGLLLFHIAQANDAYVVADGQPGGFNMTFCDLKSPPSDNSIRFEYCSTDCRTLYSSVDNRKLDGVTVQYSSHGKCVHIGFTRVNRSLERSYFLCQTTHTQCQRAYVKVISKVEECYLNDESNIEGIRKKNLTFNYTSNSMSFTGCRGNRAMTTTSSERERHAERMVCQCDDVQNSVIKVQCSTTADQDELLFQTNDGATAIYQLPKLAGSQSCLPDDKTNISRSVIAGLSSGVATAVVIICIIIIVAIRKRFCKRCKEDKNLDKHQKEFLGSTELSS